MGWGCSRWREFRLRRWRVELAQCGLLSRIGRGLFLSSSRFVGVEAGSEEIVLSFQTDQFDLCCLNCSAEIVDELLISCGYEFEAVNGVLYLLCSFSFVCECGVDEVDGCGQFIGNGFDGG